MFWRFPFVPSFFAAVQYSWIGWGMADVAQTRLRGERVGRIRRGGGDSHNLDAGIAMLRIVGIRMLRIVAVLISRTGPMTCITPRIRISAIAAAILAAAGAASAQEAERTPFGLLANIFGASERSPPPAAPDRAAPEGQPRLAQGPSIPVRLGSDAGHPNPPAAIGAATEAGAGVACTVGPARSFERTRPADPPA